MVVVKNSFVRIWSFVAPFLVFVSVGELVVAQISPSSVLHPVKTATTAMDGFIYSNNPQESTTDVDITGTPTGGADPLNDVVMSVDLGTGGVDTMVTGIGWDVTLDAFSPSWLSEAVISIQDVAYLSPGDGFDGSGTGMNFSSDGIVSLASIPNSGGTVDLSFIAVDGLLDLTFFESFDDTMIAPDGMWISDSTLTIEHQPITTGNGDFNEDGIYDCLDIDALVAEIAGGGMSGSFDLTNDRVIDRADIVAWLAEAGAVNNASGNPFFFADANLDGFVDASDFNIWNDSKFETVAAWCNGDFNADGFVDASDFNIWNDNRLSMSDNQVVPEPEFLMIGWLAILWILGTRRRRV